MRLGRLEGGLIVFDDLGHFPAIYGNTEVVGLTLVEKVDEVFWGNFSGSSKRIPTCDELSAIQKALEAYYSGSTVKRISTLTSEAVK